MNDEERIRELERQLADLQARWPRHTVSAQMAIEMEELEEELTALLAKQATGSAT